MSTLTKTLIKKMLKLTKDKQLSHLILLEFEIKILKEMISITLINFALILEKVMKITPLNLKIKIMRRCLKTTSIMRQLIMKHKKTVLKKLSTLPKNHLTNCHSQNLPR